MYYWECELCGKPVVMTNTEQRGQSCLCMDCINTELKAESQLYELTRNMN